MKYALLLLTLLSLSSCISLEKSISDSLGRHASGAGHSAGGS